MPLTHIPSLQQSISAAPLKRSRPASADAEPQPLPTRALPEAVWEGHLLPLLTCKDAARLGCTCKALRGVVREHFRGDFGRVKVDKLRSALTTFPRARTMVLDDSVQTGFGPAPQKALLQWLREEGRGEHLTGVMVVYPKSPIRTVIHKALQAGALPSLKRLDVSLNDETQRASLTRGLLGGARELRLTLNCRGGYSDPRPHVAALGLVRQLPALAKLEVQLFEGDGHPVSQWPPFIPPSLRALHINVQDLRGTPGIEAFLGALPGMLAASGARLERLEVLILGFQLMGDGLVHVAQALRCCSPTLKSLLLSGGVDLALRAHPGTDEDAFRSRVERLRVQWADVLAGVSACRELQVLVLPDIMVEPLFPPGTAFDRLTHLEISDYEREHPPDAGAMGLWELIASGGLPALAKLSVRREGRRRGLGLEEVRTRLAPGLEAVAGTLTHLHLEHSTDYAYTSEDVEMDDQRSDDVDVAYELGVAMGKLWRLKDLALGLFEDGRAYQAMAQGLAASGGDRPLPLLWRLMVPREVLDNCDQVASLLLPSVRVFISFHCNKHAPLLTGVLCGKRGTSTRGCRGASSILIRGSSRGTCPESFGPSRWALVRRL
jgi:hypothetical protein